MLAQFAVVHTLVYVFSCVPTKISGERSWVLMP